MLSLEEVMALIGTLALIFTFIITRKKDNSKTSHEQ
jgi:hypothetical protein